MQGWHPELIEATRLALELVVAVLAPAIFWAVRAVRRPLDLLQEQVSKAHTTLTQLEHHVARQNGRLGTLEHRFADHTTLDAQHQQRLHEDLRELYLRLATASHVTTSCRYEAHDPRS